MGRKHNVAQTFLSAHNETAQTFLPAHNETAQTRMSAYNATAQTRMSAPHYARLERLRAWFRNYPSALIAFSGGTDSAFLAAVAFDVLGKKALAVTADSPSLPRRELAEARSLARHIGIRHRVMRSTEFSEAAFTANPPDRCYHCKRNRFALLAAFARKQGIAVVADGSNADDLRDDRPGDRAVKELGIAQPLQAFGFTKREIRSLSRKMGLPTADKPAAACLVSRLPYRIPIDKEILARVERSEEALRRFGFTQFRVRLHGSVARIEIPPRDFPRLLRRRNAIAKALVAAGNPHIALDLLGYRMGSMNL